MKILEGIVKVVLWIAFGLFLVLLGWMFRGYKARKEQE